MSQEKQKKVVSINPKQLSKFVKAQMQEESIKEKTEVQKTRMLFESSKRLIELAKKFPKLSTDELKELMVVEQALEKMDLKSVESSLDSLKTNVDSVTNALKDREDAKKKQDDAKKREDNEKGSAAKAAMDTVKADKEQSKGSEELATKQAAGLKGPALEEFSKHVKERYDLTEAEIKYMLDNPEFFVRVISTVIPKMLPRIPAETKKK